MLTSCAVQDCNAAPFPSLLSNSLPEAGCAKARSADCHAAAGPRRRDVEQPPLLREQPGRTTFNPTVGDLDGAMEDFNQALRLDPGDAAAYDRRGQIKLVRGDFAGTIEDENRAIGLDPNSAWILPSFASTPTIWPESR